MSDYLTRLIERSIGLPRQIEPLIAPIHAPSGQMLSERVEMAAAFDSDPGAQIENPQQDGTSGTAVNARGVEPAFSPSESQPPGSSTPHPAFSRTENQPPRSSTPRAPAQAAFPIGENDQPHFTETPPNAVSRIAPTASRPEISPPTPPPIPRTTGMVSERKNRRVVQPEFISHLKQAATPAVSLLQPSPKNPPAIHVTIGRVEVRAIMPAPQVKSPPERSVPKMSLDDYLRSRNGGAP